MFVTLSGRKDCTDLTVILKEVAHTPDLDIGYFLSRKIRGCCGIGAANS